MEEKERNDPDPSPQPPLAPSAPDHPAACQRASKFLQPSTAPRRKPRPPCPSVSRHRPRSLPRSPRLVLPLPTIKGPPFFPEKTHLTSLYLLDIIASLVARRFELAGVGRAPGRAAVPGVPEPPSSRRLDKVEEEELLRRTAPPHRLSSLLRRSPPPRPSSPSVSSCAPCRGRRYTYVPVRVRLSSDKPGPFVSKVFFFSFSLPQPRAA
jgi:hypothetical protein